MKLQSSPFTFINSLGSVPDTVRYELDNQLKLSSVITFCSWLSSWRTQGINDKQSPYDPVFQLDECQSWELGLCLYIWNGSSRTWSPEVKQILYWLQIPSIQCNKILSLILTEYYQYNAIQYCPWYWQKAIYYTPGHCSSSSFSGQSFTPSQKYPLSMHMYGAVGQESWN